MCRVFPNTLKNSGKKWFGKLQKNSIHNFQQLAKEFKRRFKPNIPPKRESVDLLRYRQGQNEALKNYIERFNKEAIAIEGLNPDTALTAMKSGTRSERLQNKLMSKKPSTLVHLMTRANKCAGMEEGAKVLARTNEAIERSIPNSNNNNTNNNNGGNRGRGNRFNGRNNYKNPKEGIELTKFKADILMWIKNSGTEVQWPRKMKDNDKRIFSIGIN